MNDDANIGTSSGGEDADRGPLRPLSILITGNFGDGVLTALEQVGFKVHVAADGVEAFAAFAAGLRPHVMLLDMRVPEVMDRGLLAALQTMELLELPVVVLSDDEDPREDPSTMLFVVRAVDPLALRHIALATTHAPADASRADSAPSSGDRERTRIMVVEDDADHRSAIVDVLEDAGYSVATAAHGREALSELLSRPPSIILLDMMMPVLDGWGFMEEFKRVSTLASIPVVVLSAGSVAMFNAAPLASGYLRKPIDNNELLHTIRECLSKVQRERAAIDPGPLV